MSTTRINLEYPITHNAQTISELTLRRPTVGDNLVAQKAEASDTKSGVPMPSAKSGSSPIWPRSRLRLATFWT